MTKDLMTNIVALTGSWGVTMMTGFIHSVGLTVGQEGNVDVLAIISGLAASFMTIALAMKRMNEGIANRKKTEADARLIEAQAKTLELENWEKEIEMNKKDRNGRNTSK